MDLQVEAHIPYAPELVFSVFRDELDRLAAYLPSIRSIAITSREERGNGVVDNAIEWRAGADVPGPLRFLLGESMMFVYYGYALPLSTRIARGFYEDGIWSDTGFMTWAQISAVSWKEEGSVTLILISHFRNIAKRLEVPGNLYGQARRLLRDQIKAHAMHIGGTGLDLGSRDEADAV